MSVFTSQQMRTFASRQEVLDLYREVGRLSFLTVKNRTLVTLNGLPVGFVEG